MSLDTGLRRYDEFLGRYDEFLGRCDEFLGRCDEFLGRCDESPLLKRFAPGTGFLVHAPPAAP